MGGHAGGILKVIVNFMSPPEIGLRLRFRLVILFQAACVSCNAPGDACDHLMETTNHVEVIA
jgi:hypothetical protein